MVEDGLRIVRARRPRDVRLRARGWDRHLAHAPRSLVELVRARPDVAHALYPSDAVAASATRRPVVFSYMGLPDAAYLDERRGRRWTMEHACARADAVVALSEASARAFRDVLGVDARVISPGVDLEAFVPGAERRRSPAPTIVCSAARGEPRKRVDLLVEAVRGMDGVRLVLDRRGARPRSAEPFVELRDLDDRVGARRGLPRGVGERAAVGQRGVRARAGRGAGVRNARGRRRPRRHARGARRARGRRAHLRGRRARARSPTPYSSAIALHDDPATPARCREQAQRFSADRTTDAYVALYEELLQRRRSRRKGASANR